MSSLPHWRLDVAGSEILVIVSGSELFGAPFLQAGSRAGLSSHLPLTGTKIAGRAHKLPLCSGSSFTLAQPWPG
jgi:hypothetical protein